MKRLKRTAMALTVLVALVAVPLAAPPPAAADGNQFGIKLLNTTLNTAFGWTECPKAVWDEATKVLDRYVLATPVTAAAGCVVSTGTRYLGVIADWVTLPWNGNVIEPAIYEKLEPLVPIPTK